MVDETRRYSHANIHTPTKGKKCVNYAKIKIKNGRKQNGRNRNNNGRKKNTRTMNIKIKDKDWKNYNNLNN